MSGAGEAAAAVPPRPAWPAAPAARRRRSLPVRVAVALLIAAVSITGAAVGWRAAVLSEQATDLDRRALAETLLQEQVESNALAQVRDEERLFAEFTSDVLESELLEAEADRLRTAGAGQAGALADVAADDLVRRARDRAQLFEFIEYTAPAPDGTPTFDTEQRFADLVAQDPSFREVFPGRSVRAAAAKRDSSQALSSALVVLASGVVALTVAEVVGGGRLRVTATTIGAVLWIVGGALAAGVVDVSDERIAPFRAAVAVAASLVALLGAGIGSLQASASNDEDIAAAGAARAGIIGLRAQIEATSTFRRDLGIHVSSSLLTVDATRDAARARALGEDAAEIAVPLGEAAARRDALGTAVAELSPVVDAGSGDRRQAELEEDADRARLEQQVAASTSASHGDQADAFVAVLAVLAAVLALFGLSLVVDGAARWVLLAPALVLVVAAAVAALLTARRDIVAVPSAAIDDIAAGDRLLAVGDFDEAVERFDDAVAAAPDFAVAFDRRSQGRFLAALPSSGRGLASIPDDDDLVDAIDDAERALELGSIDPDTVSNLGWFRFLGGEPDVAVELLGRVAGDGLDDEQVDVDALFRHGVALLAAGDVDTAERAYDRALRIVDLSRDLDRFAALAAARNDLQTLREVYDTDDLGSAPAAIEGLLAEFELRRRPPNGDDEFADDVVDGSRDAAVENIDVLPTPSSLTPDIEVTGVEPGTPTAFLWFYRPEDSQPFRQLDGEADFARLDDPDSDLVAGVLDEACLPAGEYLLELFVGAELIGGRSVTLERPLGDLQVLEIPRMGTTLCVPEGWALGTQDFSDVLTPRVIVDGPDGETLALGTGAVGPQSIGRDPQELADEGLAVALSNLGTPVGSAADGPPISTTNFDGVLDLDQSRQQRVETIGGGRALAVVSVGEDRVPRIVLVQAEDDGAVDAIVDELVPTIVFRRADLEIAG